jgi:broad specificity phosphatase PhoE
MVLTAGNRPISAPPGPNVTQITAGPGRAWESSMGEDGRMGELIVIRHGETAWSRELKHTGRTDLPLTAAGQQAAKALAGDLAAKPIVATFTSPAQRAVLTAKLAGLADPQVDPDLWEWDYGGYEGMTTQEIRKERPGWYLWRDGVIPGDAAHPGETIEQVAARADRVLDRVRPLLPGGDVALVAHGHLLRILTARWLGLEPADGRLFQLATGTLSTLGTEHDEPVISTWNVPPSSRPPTA